MSISDEEWDRRINKEYGFAPVSDDVQAQMQQVRVLFRDLALYVTEALTDNRARSLALTNLQQAKMWAVQSIVDDQ